MRISLNLATRPFADLGPILKRLRVAMAALATLALALGVGLYLVDKKADAIRVQDRKLDAQIARMANERQGYQATMRQPQNAEVLAQALELNQIFDAKAFSWTLAMEDLETVLPSGVQVTTLEPTRDKNGNITLHLRVLGPRDRSIQLLENLEHSKRFLRPRMVGESSESAGGPGERVEAVSMSSRVNFDLLADYNPGPSGTRKTTHAGHDASEPAQSSPPATGAHRAPYAGPPRPTAPRKPYVGGRQ
jgi:type IV pilus assembly protein PilN